MMTTIPGIIATITLCLAAITVPTYLKKTCIKAYICYNCLG